MIIFKFSMTRALITDICYVLNEKILFRNIREEVKRAYFVIFFKKES